MKERSRTNYSVLNILTGLGGYIISVLLGFASRIVFVRFLPDEYLGISGLFTSILSVLSLAELGIGTAIVYALYKPLAEKDVNAISSLVHYFGRAYRIIGLIIAVAGLALLPFLHYIVNDPPSVSEDLRILYLFYLFNTAFSYFFSYRISLITAAQKNYIVVGLNYAVIIIQTLLQILVLSTTKSFIYFLLVQFACTMVYNIVTSLISKRMFPYTTNKNKNPLDAGTKQSLIKNIRALVITKFAGIVVNNVNNILVTFYNGLSVTGYVSNYSLLVSTLNSFLSQIFSNLTASVGNHNVKESIESRRNLFDFINLTNFWLFGWGAIGITLLSSDIISFLFGDQFVLEPLFPIVLAINFYMVGMQNAVWTYRNTLGLFRQGRYLLFLTAAINLLLSILLGQAWGIVGIFSASIFSRLITNIWYDPYVVFKYGLKSSFLSYCKRYFIFSFLLLLTTAFCIVIFSFITFDKPFNLFFKLFVCLLFPHFVFWLFLRNKEEYKFLLTIVKRILHMISRKTLHKLKK